jgi:hypothetical protein
MTKLQTQKIAFPKIVMCVHIQYYPIKSLHQVTTSGGSVCLYPLNSNTSFIINTQSSHLQLGYSFYVVLVCARTSPFCNTQRDMTFTCETSCHQYNLPSVMQRFQFYDARVQ